MNTTNVTGYSFYLNVVVIASKSAGATSSPPSKKKESSENGSGEISEEDAAAAAVLKAQMDAKKAMDSAAKSMKNLWSSSSQKAAAFVASKTMVSRAAAALDQSVGKVTEELGLDMSISRRFSQASVFVLEVDMKGCDMAILLEKTRGNEASFHYKCVRAGMEHLGAEESKRKFEAEVLPIVRKALMEKLATAVPEKMKEIKGNEDLELECIALEDQEEARWLFNFLEFMQQMK